MSIGGIFLLLSAVVFFCIVIGLSFVPQMIALGLFLLAMGILCGGMSIPWKSAG